MLGCYTEGTFACMCFGHGRSCDASVCMEFITKTARCGQLPVVWCEVGLHGGGSSASSAAWMLCLATCSEAHVMLAASSWPLFCMSYWRGNGMVRVEWVTAPTTDSGGTGRVMSHLGVSDIQTRCSTVSHAVHRLGGSSSSLGDEWNVSAACRVGTVDTQRSAGARAFLAVQSRPSHHAPFQERRCEWTRRAHYPRSLQGAC